MSDAAPQASAGDFAAGSAEATTTSPWPRFLARQIDYVLFGMLFGTIHSIVITDFLELPWLALSPLITFAWIPPEAALLALFGTTPGKWAFSLRVTGPDGDKLSLRDALVRSLRVWIQGMAFGIPFVLLVANGFAYQQLDRRGTTAWDEATPSTPHQGPLAAVRILLGFAAIAVCVTLVAWALGSAP